MAVTRSERRILSSTPSRRAGMITPHRRNQSTAYRLGSYIPPSRLLQRFTVRRRKKRDGSFFAWVLCETTDACVLLESILCMLRRVLECFEIDTGVASRLFLRPRFDFPFPFSLSISLSCGTLLDRISLRCGRVKRNHRTSSPRMSWLGR